MTGVNVSDRQQWETVHQREGYQGFVIDRTERLRVPGGWLYRTVLDDGRAEAGKERNLMAVVFVPERP